MENVRHNVRHPTCRMRVRQLLLQHALLMKKICSLEVVLISVYNNIGRNILAVCLN